MQQTHSWFVKLKKTMGGCVSRPSACVKGSKMEIQKSKKRVKKRRRGGIKKRVPSIGHLINQALMEI
ncbi:hypothetical protein Leryth_020461 [Lithospermum erythrorhizon]|nr:hypothetical protein Leryth_020461 [Lithospermum erythrorhizon]